MHPGSRWRNVPEEGGQLPPGPTDRSGGGTGRSHLAVARGLPTAMLYVDADNAAAVRVYESLGFATHETDLMYRTET